MTTQIKIQKSKNKFAWSNKFVDSIVYAELNNLDKKDKSTRLVYHVYFKENYLNVDSSLIAGFIETDECTVLK
jgi:hypothetical protein